MNFLKKIFQKKQKKDNEFEYEYENTFKYDYNDVVSRARAVNTVTMEAAAHMPALINLLGQGEALGDDTAVQVDDAIKATALAIETSMAVFSTVIKLAGETEYRRYRK